MPKPPSSAATPRPAPELLARLTTLAQELAGAFRPTTVVEVVARALAELLQPDRLSVILLDAESNRLAVTYDTHPVPARTDDPLLQLALPPVPQRELQQGVVGAARAARGPQERTRRGAGPAAPAARRRAPPRLLARRTAHRRQSHDGRGLPLERAARRAGEGRADARLRGARAGGDRARECPPGGAPLLRQARVGEDGRRHLPGDLHRGRPRHRASRQPRVRRPDPDRGHRDSRPAVARAPPARLVGPRGARPRRAVGEHGGDPRGRAHAAPDRHPDGRAGLRGPRLRGPDRTAPVAGATHTV